MFEGKSTNWYVQVFVGNEFFRVYEGFPEYKYALKVAYREAKKGYNTRIFKQTIDREYIDGFRGEKYAGKDIL